MTEEKSLDKWRLELRTIGKKHWANLWESFLGVRPTSLPRLYKAVNNYGELIVLEAIVEASNRELTGDPFNYVMKIASNKWREAQLEQDSQDEYLKSIDEAKKRSRAKNAALEKKLRGKGNGNPIHQ